MTRAIFLLPLTLLLSGCGALVFVPDSPQTQFVDRQTCLEMPEYSDAQQKALSDELPGVAKNYPVSAQVIIDAVNLRKANRKACENVKK
jgi:hypothetical protein